MTGKQNGNRRHFGRVRQLPSGRWQAHYPSPTVADMIDLEEDH